EDEQIAARPTWARSEPPFREAADALSMSSAPVVWAGGGAVASGASAELVRIAERLAAPVITTYMGRTAIPADHPLAVSLPPHEPAVRRLLAEADALLAVATDFGATITMNGALVLPDRMVRIDVDPAELERTRNATALLGDAR